MQWGERSQPKVFPKDHSEPTQYLIVTTLICIGKLGPTIACGMRSFIGRTTLWCLARECPPDFQCTQAAGVVATLAQRKQDTNDCSLGMEPLQQKGPRRLRGVPCCKEGGLDRRDPYGW
jgi:hypothetical protein